MNKQQNPSFSTLPYATTSGRMPFVQFGGYFYMEIWKDVKGYEGVYQVSSKGSVRSLDRYINRRTCTGVKALLFVKGRVLKAATNRGGYAYVILTDSKPISKTAHRLVAITFIPNPDNKPEVNHINGIKTDNRVENLEWCTHQENVQHAFRTGLKNADHARGSRNKMSKLNRHKVRAIRWALNSNYIVLDLAKYYGVSMTTIYNIRKRKTWKHL